MSLLSKSCVYGLRATLYIASFSADRKFVPIREVADELGLSFHFITKILQQLTEAGLMESYRGPNGGIALARTAAKMSLFDVVKALDGESMFRTCLLGLAECSDKHPCPLHDVWGRQREQLMAALKRATLRDLRNPVASEMFRLSDGARNVKRKRK